MIPHHAHLDIYLALTHWAQSCCIYVSRSTVTGVGTFCCITLAAALAVVGSPCFSQIPSTTKHRLSRQGQGVGVGTSPLLIWEFSKTWLDGMGNSSRLFFLWLRFKGSPPPQNFVANWKLLMLSGVATVGQGAIPPPGSIQALKKYTFSMWHLRRDAFFGGQFFDFEIHAPTSEGFAPLEHFLATPLLKLPLSKAILCTPMGFF